jgi:hypothetical protein
MSAVARELSWQYHDLGYGDSKGDKLVMSAAAVLRGFTAGVDLEIGA